MHAASAAAPRLLASSLGTPLGDRLADRRRAPARLYAPPPTPPDAGKPPKRKLNLDLDLGQVLGAIKRGEGALNTRPRRSLRHGRRQVPRRPQQVRPLAPPNTAPCSRPASSSTAIVFGSRAAVGEYKTFESTLPADAALGTTANSTPGTARRSPAKAQGDPRELLAVLGRTRLIAPILARQTRDFVATRVARDASPGTTSASFASGRSSSSSWAPSRPTRSWITCTRTTRALALGKLPGVEDGQKPLDELTCLKHYRTVRAQGELTDPSTSSSTRI